MIELTYKQILDIILKVHPESEITFGELPNIKLAIEKIINQ